MDRATIALQEAVMLNVIHPLPDTVDESMTVEVEVRDRTEVIRWYPDRIEGPPSVLSRLGHPSDELLDPVVFLDTVRRCFGEGVDVRCRN